MSNRVNNIVPKQNKLVWLFVFSLALLSPLSIQFVAFNSFSHYVIVLIILSVILNGYKERKLYLSNDSGFFVLMVLAWLGITLIDSIIYHSTFGEINGQDTFHAILGSCYFHVFFCISFLCIMKFMKSTKAYLSIDKAMDAIIIFSISIGIIQLGILYNIPGFKSLYDIINLPQFLATSDFVILTGRIFLTGSEPASLGIILCVLIMPYLFMQIETGVSVKSNRIKLITCYFFAFLSKSTTVYVIIVILTATYLIKSQLNKEENVKAKIFLILFAAIILLLLIFFIFNNLSILDFLGSKDDVYSVRYILINKAFDSNNQSSTHRWTTTVNDLAIFREYPLLGVGDGNQGFFYNKNIGTSFSANTKTQEFLRGEAGVVNGGAFFFAILSGCGILGLIPFFGFMKRYLSRYRRSLSATKYSLWLSYAIAPIILELLTGAMNMTIVFILTIPFWEFENNEVQ